MTDPMSHEELRACRERAEAATPGPWGFKLGALKAYVYSTDPGEELGFSMQALHPDDGRDVPAAANAAFIAHAREDVPRLLGSRAAMSARAEKAESAAAAQYQAAWDALRPYNDARDPEEIGDLVADIGTLVAAWQKRGEELEAAELREAGWQYSSSLGWHHPPSGGASFTLAGARAASKAYGIRAAKGAK